MPDYSKNIVYLSKEQYQTLITNQSVTANGQTITYNENDIYVTPQAEPITDVRANGTSITSNGIANIPLMASNVSGLIQYKDGYGLQLIENYLLIQKASDAQLKAGTEARAPITAGIQDSSVFYGLSKIAGADLKNETVTLGTYPDSSKAAIQSMLGVSDLLAPSESTLVASQAYAVGDVFTANGKLYKVTAAIVSGESIVVQDKGETVSEHKAEEVTVGEYTVHDVQINGTSVTSGGVVNIPIGQENVGLGVVRPRYGLYCNPTTGNLDVLKATDSAIKNGAGDYAPIVPTNQYKAVFYGLSKVAGVDLANETVTLGTYPETSKTAIRALIGAGTPLDVQVNGTSIVSNGVANIPYASASTLGLVKIPDGLGIYINPFNGELMISSASSTNIKEGTNVYRPVSPAKQHESTFYGLAKAAGDTTQSQSDNAVGTYTAAAKTAIRSMLGATSSNVIEISDTQPTDIDNKIWLPETAPAGIEVPTYAEFQAGLAGKVSDVKIGTSSIVSNGVAEIPIASSSNLGVIKVRNDTAQQAFNNGGSILLNNILYYVGSPSAAIKAGTDFSAICSAATQHESTFYGLARAAGDTTQSQSSNAVGTYTNNAKAAIQNMLGISNLLAPIETVVASKAYEIGEIFTSNGKLYKATAAIAASDTIVTQDAGETVSGSNAEEVKVSEYAVRDVKIAETSITSNGVANITLGNGLIYNNNNLYVKTDAYSPFSFVEGAIRLQTPSDNVIKDPSASANYGHNLRAISPLNQHKAVFYGLAKAAGDTTQSASSNAVGTYTDNAKASIKSMLGIVDGSTGTVTVTGTTPTITAVENTRYVCGEVSTLSITPPVSGICIIRFTSGTTAAVVTVPNTVKFPEWFDITALDANTIYEMCITDGIYGAVMSWAL